MFDRWNLPVVDSGWGLVETYTLTVTSDPMPIMEKWMDGNVSWIGLKVRSMGTASYVAIGSELSQEFRFGLAAKDYIELGRNGGRPVNPQHTYIKSDGSAVVEVLVLW